MNQVNKFYLKQAVYQVEVDGSEYALLMDYAGNKYEVIGKDNSRIDEIATALLSKKHGVNFAYKFSAQGRSASGGNDRINEENL